MKKYRNNKPDQWSQAYLEGQTKVELLLLAYKAQLRIADKTLTQQFVSDVRTSKSVQRETARDHLEYSRDQQQKDSLRWMELRWKAYPKYRSTTKIPGIRTSLIGNVFRIVARIPWEGQNVTARASETRSNSTLPQFSVCTGAVTNSLPTS